MDMYIWTDLTWPEVIFYLDLNALYYPKQHRLALKKKKNLINLLISKEESYKTPIHVHWTYNLVQLTQASPLSSCTCRHIQASLFQHPRTFWMWSYKACRALLSFLSLPNLRQKCPTHSLWEATVGIYLHAIAIQLSSLCQFLKGSWDMNWICSSDNPLPNTSLSASASQHLMGTCAKLVG